MVLPQKWQKIVERHIWFNKFYLKYNKICYTFALKYEETFSPI